MNGKAIVVLATGTLLLPAYGAEPVASDAAEAVPVETYAGPERVELARPRYPDSLLCTDAEGWVRLDFMLDTDGHPYEISVVDSVGDEAFEDAAVVALQRSRFEPARLDGRPIVAGASQAYTFKIAKTRDGARRRFRGRYHRAIEAIEAGDRERADRLLTRLEPDNLYENAYVNLGRYRYYRKWGEGFQQLAALRRAVGPDETRSYLEGSARDEALRVLFLLQMELHDFGGALETADRLSGVTTDGDLQAMIGEAQREIEALRDDGQRFAVDGAIDEASTSWYLKLLKDEFALDHVSGRVSEIKLRCAGRFVGFAYDETLSYRVSDRYMPCDLEIVGDPGTTFRLIQF